MSKTSLTQSAAWRAVQEHAARLHSSSLLDLFASDTSRFSRMQCRMPGMMFDYSKQNLDAAAVTALVALAEQQDVAGWRGRMFAGEKINHTEGRAVLHTALRRPFTSPLLVDGADIMPDIAAVHQRMTATVQAVRSGAWRGVTGERITAIINIGIGGSDFGPRMVVAALEDYKAIPQAHFVANVDADELQRVFARCKPEQTLFVVASKTFTTQETMLNANTARQWLVDHLGESSVAHHMLAVSTNLVATKEFGLPDDNVFGFWDWVGGRYSLWSSIGLSIALALGMEQFDALRAGAAAMDDHFRTAPLAENIPVLLALIGVWNRNFRGCASLAVLPYAERLRLFPTFLQQLEMESNGKSVNREGEALDYATSPVLFGSAGTIGQHSYYQMLHQGTDIIPADFIGILHNEFDDSAHEAVLHAHMLAQPEALLRGRDAVSLAAVTANPAIVPHRVAPGNRCSTMLLLDKLDAYHLGLLIALYEHKVFVQGVVWEINSFDQWGVELGKQLAGSLYHDLLSTTAPQPRDASTNGLLSLLQHAAVHSS
jgi:glucose-6-phosphate isomerase